MCSPAILHVPFEIVENDESRQAVEDWIDANFVNFNPDTQGVETPQDCIFVLPVDYKGKWKIWCRLLVNLVIQPGIPIRQWEGYVSFKKDGEDKYINFRVYQDGGRDWNIEITQEGQGFMIAGEFTEERRLLMGFPPQDPDGFVASEEI